MNCEEPESSDSEVGSSLASFYKLGGSFKGVGGQ